MQISFILFSLLLVILALYTRALQNGYVPLVAPCGINLDQIHHHVHHVMHFHVMHFNNRVDIHYQSKV